MRRAEGPGERGRRGRSFLPTKEQVEMSKKKGIRQSPPNNQFILYRLYYSDLRACSRLGRNLKESSLVPRPPDGRTVWCQKDIDVSPPSSCAPNPIPWVIGPRGYHCCDLALFLPAQWQLRLDMKESNTTPGAPLLIPLISTETKT